MITLDITLLVQIINLLVLMVVLNAVLYKPVRSILAARREKIAEFSRAIDLFRENAEQMQQDIDGKLIAARRNAQAELEKCRNEAQRTGAEEVAGKRAASDARKNEQLAEIRKNAGDAARELGTQVENFSRAMAGKILGRGVN